MKNNTHSSADKTHIFHVLPSFGHGGMPIGVSCIMNHFGTKAHHSLHATMNEYGCTVRLKDDVDYNIPDISPPENNNIFSRVRHYIKIIKEMNPDVLLTYNWGSTEWALAASFIPGITHYHLEHGFGPDEAHSTLLKRDIFRRIALRNMNGIIIPSQNLVTICKEKWKFPDEKIHYIANGVDCDRFGERTDDTIIKGFTRNSDEIIIGTLTPLRPEKNLSRLIKAYKAVKDKLPTQKIRLLIMGEGRERPILEKLITDLNITNDVILAGHVENPEHALGLLDIYCMSSDTEQMPIAIQEAMAAGLPIIGIDVGDVKNVMHRENKEYITPLGDEQAYIEAIVKLSSAPKTRQQLSQINKKHVRDYYSEEVMCKNYAPFWGVKY